jgi:hypothetical protein
MHWDIEKWVKGLDEEQRKQLLDELLEVEEERVFESVQLLGN